MRTRTPINLTEEERERLEAMSRSRTLEGRLVQRAKMVLLAAEGLSNRNIGARLGIDYRTVMCWQNRFRKQGFDGIEKEVPGRGRKPRIQAETILEVVERTLKAKPEDATQWSLRRMAQASGLSKSTVHRICQTRGLKPHLCDTF